MKFTYDPRYNIAYICFKEKTEGVETLKLSDELCVDMSPDGTLYGVELLNANEQLKSGSLKELEIINEASSERITFPLAS
ncbi:MAG: DUF2283 domain-containing protein [Ignavibacteriales bacterium]|nr:DUF2283 domain-containing protein [Ignavibacteriales bacterium]